MSHLSLEDEQHFYLTKRNQYDHIAIFVSFQRAAAAQGPINDGSASFTLSNNNQPRLLDMNTNASNSLMFLILGVLAGAMLIVMVFLVAICFFRQRKEKLRLLAQVNAGDKGECSLATRFFLNFVWYF